MAKIHPTIGCCGIDCGLCPRYYTDGSSKCPGCGGEGFDDKHPPCSIKSCCANKHKLEACGQCPEYPCDKYTNMKGIERDSFVTHKKMFHNQDQIKTQGIEAFIEQQSERIALLKDMLADYNDGRSKSFYCTAVALLHPEHIKKAMANITPQDDKKNTAKELKTTLRQCAEAQGIELSLR